MAKPRTAAITGLVLAGGEGSRLGGSDKGLVMLAERPLIAYVLDRLAPQVETLMISANRNLEVYRTLGHPIVSDTLDDYPGPLAGILSGMARCITPWLATAPCDCPFLPTDLVRRLAAGIDHADSIAVASAGGRLQSVFALIPINLQRSLAAFLAEGERKIARWYARHHCVTIDFGADDSAFDNINTAEDLGAAAARIQNASRS